jgi:uncharacterized protein YaaN involved in tellurite resistance
VTLVNTLRKEDPMGEDYFSLELPSEEKIQSSVTEAYKPTLTLTPEQKASADQIVDGVIDALSSTEAQITLQKSLDNYGQDIVKSIVRKSKFLAVSVGELSKVTGEGGGVSKSLNDLEEELNGLNPKNVDFTSKGFLGLFNPVKKYFSRYQNSEIKISDIMLSLDRSKSGLKNDNITLKLEEKEIKENCQKLMDETSKLKYICDTLDNKLNEYKTQKREGNDDVKYLTETLFSLNQRLLDMQQTLLVSQQGLIAMEIIQKNNNELARGIDRAQTVTMLALRSSVLVAGALYNQKIALKKLDALNIVSDSALKETSRELKNSNFMKSSSGTPSLESLQNSFDDAFKSLDEIKRYKEDATVRRKFVCSLAP